MRKIVALPIGDFIFSIFAFYFSWLMRFGLITGTENILHAIGVKFCVFGSILIFSSYIFGIYDQEKNRGKKELLLRVCVSIFVTLFILSFVYYIIPSLFLGRGVLALSLIFSGILQFLWHLSYNSLRQNGLARNILILGSGPMAQRIGELVKSRNHQYVFAGHINLPSEQLCLPMCDESINGNSLEDTVKNENAQKIVVSLSERRGVLPMREVLACKLNGIEVVDAPTFYEEITGKLLIEDITPGWFIFCDGFRITPLKCTIKRIIDISFAVIGLIFFSVLFPLVALAIKISSSGPIFYKQVRLGIREKPYTIYKLRTMYFNAEEQKGAIWAEHNDSRITLVGKLIRKIRIDEIPQFYNVLKGDMSIVGPRPERPEFVEKLKSIIPYYSERHCVKPGITGWAQIRYAYGATVDDTIEKLRYDLYYVKHFSIFFDLIIMIETIKVVLFGRGAR